MNKWLLILAILVIQACGNTSENNASNEAEETKQEELETSTTSPAVEAAATEIAPEDRQSEEYLGYYVGLFEGVDMDFDKNPAPLNKITISIDSLSGEMLYGHSVVAGNQRPFTGQYELAEDSITVVASEPGDDRYDGVFTFAILPKEKTLVGTWKANNQRLAVSSRQYSLDKKSFEYDPNLSLSEEVGWSNLYEKYPKYPDKTESLTEDVSKFNASTYELKKEDVENMYQGDLEVMRNAIYARHGYSFKNRKMRFIFDHEVEWYMPVSTDIRGQLTALEKKNIDLLKRYEQHAERYYDEFGR